MLKVSLVGAAAVAVGGFGVGGLGAHNVARARMSAPTMEAFYDFSGKTIDGKETSMSDFKGKPVLILNVASLWGTTTQDFTAMNALAEKYGDKVAILAFPCNQFGHQTNEDDGEFLNTLKYVRPGNNFEPAETITVFEKTMVNGLDAAPLFKWLKTNKVVPCDEFVDTKGNGCADPDALVLPREKFGGSTVVLWTPVARSDIAWNFEKFLVGPDGAFVERFSRYYDTNAIAKDIDALL